MNLLWTLWQTALVLNLELQAHMELSLLALIPAQTRDLHGLSKAKSFPSHILVSTPKSCLVHSAL